MYPNPKYQSTVSRVFLLTLIPDSVFSEIGLLWVETMVSHILSWGKVGCLGCFVDFRLQICSSSNRRARAFYLGFVLRKTFVEWAVEGVVPGFLCPLCSFYRSVGLGSP